MYKDKDKQREANKEAAKRYRAKRKGMTQSMTQGMTNQQPPITPEQVSITAPADRLQSSSVTAEPSIAEFDKIAELYNKPVKTQSYNPMMVGYVPPKGQVR